MAFGSDEAACRGCHALYPSSDLDRYLWCPRCREAVSRRGAVWSRTVGVLASLGVALYVAVALSPQRSLLLYVPVLIITYVIAARIARGVVRVYYRARGGAAGGPTSWRGGD